MALEFVSCVKYHNVQPENKSVMITPDNGQTFPLKVVMNVYQILTQICIRDIYRYITRMWYICGVVYSRRSVYT